MRTHSCARAHTHTHTHTRMHTHKEREHTQTHNTHSKVRANLLRVPLTAAQLDAIRDGNLLVQVDKHVRSCAAPTQLCYPSFDREMKRLHGRSATRDSNRFFEAGTHLVELSRQNRSWDKMRNVLNMSTLCATTLRNRGRHSLSFVLACLHLTLSVSVSSPHRLALGSTVKREFIAKPCV